MSRPAEPTGQPRRPAGRGRGPVLWASGLAAAAVGNVAVLEQAAVDHAIAYPALAVLDLLLLTGGGLAAARRLRRPSRTPAEPPGPGGPLREADLADAPPALRSALHDICTAAGTIRASPAHARGLLGDIDADLDQVLYDAADRTAQVGRLRAARRRLEPDGGPAHTAAVHRARTAAKEALAHLDAVRAELTAAADGAVRLSQHLAGADDAAGPAPAPIQLTDLQPPAALQPPVGAADIAARIAAVSAGYDEIRRLTDAVLTPEDSAGRPPPQQPSAPPTDPGPRRHAADLTVVCLGDGRADTGWLTALNDALTGAGQPALPAERVLVPHFRSLLGADGIAAKMPAVTYKPGRDDPAQRRLFERRQAGVARLLGRPAPAPAGTGPTPGTGPDRRRTQVARYLDDDGVRAAILASLLEQLPTGGALLLIGHGLGAVIAIDLLDHLDPQVQVRRLLTLGVPADCPALRRRGDQLLKHCPYPRVGDWTNCYATGDAATGGRGIAALFTAAQDVEVTLGGGTHPAARYLRTPAATELVVDALYPRADTDDDGDDDPGAAVGGELTDEQFRTLLTLHFATAVAGHCRDRDRAQRYTDALRVVEDEITAGIRRALQAGERLPAELHTLLAGRLPALPHRLRLREATAVLVTMAAGPLVEPYDIDTGDAARQAIVTVAAELGFRKETATDIVRAITEVDGRLKGGGGIPLTRIGAAAAGVALLAAGPIGLALAAPVGLTGGAAIIGGLAAFGPGGLLGGLGTVAGLAAGGAAVTTGAALGGPAAEVLSVNAGQLSIRVAINNAFKRLELVVEPDLWTHLTAVETQVCNKLNRLEPFSDPRAPRLQRLRDTRDVVTKLLEFVVEKGICAGPAG